MKIIKELLHFLFVALLVNGVQASPGYGAVQPLDGWPRLTNGGATFSPALLRTPDGGRILLHNQALPFPVDRLTPGPWLVARDSHGVVLDGWPAPVVNYMPFRPPAIAVDDDGVATAIFSVSRAVLNAFALDGTPLPGWPQFLPESTGGVPVFGRAGPSLGDVDGDGVVEVVMADDIGRVSVWRQDGNLFPGWPVMLPMPSNGNSPSVLATPAASDLDGDGLLDVVVAQQNGVLAVYDRFGRMKPGWPVDMSLDTSFATGFAIVPLGDGTRGIAVGTFRSEFLLFRHNGQFVDGWPVSVGGGSIEPVAAGDLDGDGVPEILAGDQKRMWVLRLNGEVMEGWPQEISEGLVCQYQPLVADITGDGRPDVLLAVEGTPLWGIYRWESDGTPIGSFPFRPGSATSLDLNQAPSLGDLNGDGLLDFATASEVGALPIIPGRIHVFTFNVPVDESTLHWTTPAHDLQRTSTWTPPTRLFGGRGRVFPGRIQLSMAPPVLIVSLNTPREAPLDDSLAVTALGGVRLESPIALRQVSRPVAVNDRQHVIGMLDGRTLISRFQDVSQDHPELLWTDDEIRDWLEDGLVPEIAPHESRPLWLTIESPRIGIRKLKAHVRVKAIP